jgi:galactokinase
MLESIKDELIEKFGRQEGEMIYRRSLHPILENDRVLAMKKAFVESDYESIGRLLAESHESLRENYEVSCDELNIAVSLSHKIDGIIGSRMIGGGFGGCTINLVKKGTARHFRSEIEEKFRKATDIKGNAYICEPSDGVRGLTK